MKQARRFIKRLAARRGITYESAIDAAFGKHLEITDQNIYYSLNKVRNKGKEAKRKAQQRRESRQKKENSIPKAIRKNYTVTMEAAAEILESLKGQDVLIVGDPDILDFTDPKRESRLILSGAGTKATLPLDQFREIERLAHALPEYLDGLLVGWNIKSINSFLKFKVGEVKWKKTIYDLKLIEAYLGIEGKKPENSYEAISRLKKAIQHPSWEKFKKFYTEVYVPLVNEALPAIETNCLTSQAQQQCVYAHYEPEGQANGRMSTTKVFKQGYLPHSLTSADKESLRSPYHEEMFLMLDYRHMEVSVLGWLSSDPVLAEILDSGVDLYKGIWTKMTGIEATDAHRDLCKLVFLPVIYGCGVKTLAKNLGKDEKFASGLITRVYKTFPVATRWVSSQETNEHGIATDAFGRQRHFDEAHKIRNFVVQSPASMICLRKLVRLHQNLGNTARLAYHLHDEYAILVDVRTWKTVLTAATKVLEDEDYLFPGLRLKVGVRAGQTLKDLEKIQG